MVTYVAFLRGIAPMNPNMHNDKLRHVFEALGYTNVRSVIASGNILFDTSRTDIPALETDIEQALYKSLGITSTTIIRSAAQIRQLIDTKPFGGAVHSPTNYLLVTFLQTKPPHRLHIPELYGVVAQYDQEVCSVIDNTSTRKPDPTIWLEKNYSKAISTRTWLTIERIMKKLDA